MTSSKVDLISDLISDADLPSTSETRIIFTFHCFDCNCCDSSSEVKIAGDFVPLIDPLPSIEITDEIVRFSELRINSASSEYENQEISKTSPFDISNSSAATWLIATPCHPSYAYQAAEGSARPSLRDNVAVVSMPCDQTSAIPSSINS